MLCRLCSVLKKGLKLCCAEGFQIVGFGVAEIEGTDFDVWVLREAGDQFFADTAGGGGDEDGLGHD